MAAPFVETVRIQNFGCVLDASLELTRLHALIGPNDSGKSTVLAAFRTAADLTRSGDEQLRQEHRLDPRGVPGSNITVRGGGTQLGYVHERHRWNARYEGDPSAYNDAFVRGATLVRWDPDAIRRPCELVPEGRSLAVGERGDGLPAIYEAILSRDRVAFDEIEEGLREHFPTVRSIWLPTSKDRKKTLGVTLNDGAKVHANEMSEGLLYWLAFAALPHVDPAALVLVEEPENGLHPSRIAEVVKVLRAISNRTQVILATHSPLVINELQPDEVTILTRDPQTGTRATRLDRTKHFQQRQKVYALGELWLSFADGVEEAALVSDDKATTSTG